MFQIEREGWWLGCQYRPRGTLAWDHVRVERRRRGRGAPVPWWVHAATVAIVAGSIAVALGGRTVDEARGERGDVLSTTVEGPPATTAIQPPPTEVPTPPQIRFAPPTTTTSSLPEVLRIELVGDSLLASATSHVVAALHDAVVGVDAEPGRTIAQGRRAIANAVAARPDAVVIALGTNDWASPIDELAEHLDEIGQIISDAPCVVWIDTQEFRPGLERVNSEVRRVAELSRDTHVARWSILAGPPEFHLADGYHLSEDGRLLFAGLIETAIDLYCT